LKTLFPQKQSNKN